MSHRFDLLLQDHVGPSGPFQWSQLLVILLSTLACSLTYMMHLFTAYTPPHRCFVPLCDSGNSSLEENWISMAIPESDNRREMLSSGQRVSECTMFRQLEGAGSCQEESFDRETAVRCRDYVYDEGTFEETLTTELDLVCDEGFKVGLFGTIMMIGMMVGSVVGGFVGDKFGRRRALIGAMIVLSPTVAIEGFSTNYGLSLGLKLVAISSVSVVWVSSHALVLELFGKSSRKKAYVIHSVSYPFFTCPLALVAYLVRSWRDLHFWLGGACVAMLPFFIFLDESIRWMVLNGREAEAESLLIKAGRMNGREIDNVGMLKIRKIICKMAASSKNSHDTHLSPLDMIKRPFLGTTVVILTIWVSSILAAYALSLNVTSLDGDIFINFTLSFLVEVPAMIYNFLLMDRIGRRPCIMISQLVLGATCLAMAFISQEESRFMLALFLVGKFSAICSINMAWLYTAELYPTNLRGQAVGTCSLVSRIMGTTASHVPRLAAYWRPLPLLVLGIPALASSLLTPLLPETKDKVLIDMAREASEMDLKVDAARIDLEDQRGEEKEVANAQLVTES